MQIDLNNFLHSLAKYIVATAAAQTPSVVIPYAYDAAHATPPGKLGLWRHEVQEDFASDPYSVLRVYGGPPTISHPLLRMNVQCMTVGIADEDAIARAYSVFQTLFDGAGSAGNPKLMRGINGYLAADDSADGTYLLVYLWAQQRCPGLLGRDDRGRREVDFNFEIGVHKES